MNGPRDAFDFTAATTSFRLVWIKNNNLRRTAGDSVWGLKGRNYFDKNKKKKNCSPFAPTPMTQYNAIYIIALIKELNRNA